MRFVLSTVITAFLTACSMSSTPTGGSCATRVSTELNALNAAIQTAETNLSRGYVIERQYSDDGLDVTEIEVPINTAQEQQKLEGLKARLADVQTRTSAALAQCR